MHRLEQATAAALHQYEAPFEDFAFHNVSIPSGGNLRAFTPEEDQFLLCLAHMHGNGAGKLFGPPCTSRRRFALTSCKAVLWSPSQGEWRCCRNSF